MPDPMVRVAAARRADEGEQWIGARPLLLETPPEAIALPPGGACHEEQVAERVGDRVDEQHVDYVRRDQAVHYPSKARAREWACVAAGQPVTGVGCCSSSEGWSCAGGLEVLRIGAAGGGIGYGQKACWRKWRSGHVRAQSEERHHEP